MADDTQFDRFKWAYPVIPDEVLAALDHPDFPKEKPGFPEWTSFIDETRAQLRQMSFSIPVHNHSLRQRTCNHLIAECNGIAARQLHINPSHIQFQAFMREMTRTVGVRTRLGSFKALDVVAIYLAEKNYVFSPFTMKRHSDGRIKSFADDIISLLKNFPVDKAGQLRGRLAVCDFLKTVTGHEVSFSTIKGGPVASKIAQAQKPQQSRASRGIKDQSERPTEEGLNQPIQVTFDADTSIYDYDGRDVVLLKTGAAFAQLLRKTRSGSSRPRPKAIGFLLNSKEAAVVPIFDIAEKADPKGKKKAAVDTGRKLLQPRTFRIE